MFFGERQWVADTPFSYAHSTALEKFEDMYCRIFIVPGSHITCFTMVFPQGGPGQNRTLPEGAIGQVDVLWPPVTLKPEAIIHMVAGCFHG